MCASGAVQPALRTSSHQHPLGPAVKARPPAGAKAGSLSLSADYISEFHQNTQISTQVPAVVIGAVRMTEYRNRTSNYHVFTGRMTLKGTIEKKTEGF